MCGIVGFAGDAPAAPFLYEGLRRLEYRGYDSYGVIVEEDDGTYSVAKSLLPVSQRKPLESIGKVGIGHTRWSTNGRPCTKNAHPIGGGKDSEYSCYVVHNGVVENYQELRLLLETNGYVFTTDTDTEVIAHLFDYESQLPLVRDHYAVAHIARCVLARLKGKNAFVVLSRRSPGLLALAANGSPLLFTANGHVASDPMAFSGYSQQCFRLRDGEGGCVGGSKSCFCDSFGMYHWAKPQEPVPAATPPMATADDRPSMLKEIEEQPKLLRNYESSFWLAQPKRVVLFGCGSSWHAALLGRFYFEAFGIKANAEYACEVASHLIEKKNVLYVALTQSGETRDVLDAMEAVRPKRTVVALTNTPHSQAGHLADHSFHLNAGMELGVAATKTFTLEAARLLEWASRYERDIARREKIMKVLHEELPNAINRLLGDAATTKLLASEVVKFDHSIFLANDIHYPVALEGALKVKEVSYQHAEAMPASEIKHGPLALIDGDVLSLFILGELENVPRILANMNEVRTRGGRTWAICPEGVAQEVKRAADEVWVIPSVGDRLVQPLVANVALQLVAVKAAAIKGLDVDRPRNLAKCVSTI